MVHKLAISSCALPFRGLNDFIQSKIVRHFIKYGNVAFQFAYFREYLFIVKFYQFRHKVEINLSDNVRYLLEMKRFITLLIVIYLQSDRMN